MVEVLTEVIERGASTMVPLSIAYWAALIATGKLDATIFPSPYPWETAAIKLLVEEAGGKVTDLYGEDQRYDGNIRGHVASNGLLHDELTEIVRRINGVLRDSEEWMLSEVPPGVIREYRAVPKRS